MSPTKTEFYAILLGVSLHVPVFAQDSEEDTTDGPLDLGEFPGMIIDDVVVPVPSEIFSIMGKLGEETFESEIVTRKNLSFRNRSRQLFYSEEGNTVS